MKVYNLSIEMKQENFDKFADFIRNQFKHGAEKYALDSQSGKEMTDLVCEFDPGKSGVDWILGTIVKYCGRFKNFRRERDLFKIATYCYLAWLKCGFQYSEKHDEDVGKEKKDVGED